MSFIKKELEKRTYQANIFDSSKDKNSLIVIPTGLGKTMISIMLIDHRLSEYPDSKALFVAPTKPLINQHYRTFDEFVSLPLGTISGSVSKEKRKEIYDNSRVIFATPQTIENDLKNGVLDLGGFSILIVDEAHHAIGNYSYVRIADSFSHASKHPNIVALTASPASDHEKIMSICRNLNISNIEIRSEDDPDVKPYVKTKLVEERRIDLQPELRSLVDATKLVLDSCINSLKQSGFFKDTQASRINRMSVLLLQKKLQAQMIRGGRSFYTIRGIIATAKILKIYHAINLVSTQSLRAFEAFLEKIIKHAKSKTDKELAKDPAVIQLYERSKTMLDDGVEHPKLSLLKSILESELKGAGRAIVFTQYRDTADIIEKLLRSCPDIRAVKFIGQGKQGLTQKEQIEIVKDFEAGVYNALISTSVSEEGISIKGVDLAVFYETIPSGIRSIQRRGRVGRFNVGKVYVLITNDTNDEGYYWISKRKEKRMKNIVKNIRDNPILIKNDGTLKPFT